MAIKATIFKVDLQIADIDRNYYCNHPITIARHPSETNERMMMRLLVFALHADETLLFANGLSAGDEPDLWKKDLTGNIQFWIDVGMPDEKLIKKASGRAERVFVYTYGGRIADMWWEQCHKKLESIDNLTVINLPQKDSLAIAQQAQRNMRLNCTIQDGQVWLTDQENSIFITPVIMM
ncbi:hypothetical protein LBMAG32_10190 [Nitrosomonadaceae bacterium]|nr:hypothetical protein LBMAG32_10190 [Nitrosomonadaceae bacterium]